MIDVRTQWWVRNWQATLVQPCRSWVSWLKYLYYRRHRQLCPQERIFQLGNGRPTLLEIQNHWIWSKEKNCWTPPHLLYSFPSTNPVAGILKLLWVWLPLHDFLQAFHRFGHHIGHFLRSVAIDDFQNSPNVGSNLRATNVSKATCNWLATHFRNRNLMPSTHLALVRKNWCVLWQNVSSPKCWFRCGWFEAFFPISLSTYSTTGRTTCRCRLTTDPEFLGLMAFNHG